MERRTFLQQVSLGALALGAAGTKGPAVRASQYAPAQARAREMAGDVVIVGGGTGGVAAALSAARNGLRVVLTEETDWLGGQLTAQAVPPDEHPWIESFGCTRAYRELRSRVREYYRRNYPLTAQARAVAYLNPGNGDVSRLCHEPRAALAVLHEMLAPFLSGARLTVLLRHKPVAATAAGDTVTAVTVKDLRAGGEVTLTAPYIVDATELGDLLPLTKTEYVSGAEPQAETSEPHAASQAEPASQQAFTCCFAMDYVEGEDHTIEKPRDYDFWKNYVPQLMPPWPGRLLAWNWPEPQTLGVAQGFLDPTGKFSVPGASNLWLYRRIADRRNFTEGTYPSDITLVNWPQNDYLLGNLVGVSPEDAARHLTRAKQLSLSLLYWMQTEAPRPDDGAGWRGLRLRKDVVDTEDGLAKSPYIRESRRIKAEFTVLEQHVGTEARRRLTGLKSGEMTTEPFRDSVGVGSYRIDLHPSTTGSNYIDISSLPFQIPLGAFIPRRVENLLPASKNIGTTHITNGCYRLHPVEWNIGESVGALAAFCLSRRVRPRQVRNNRTLLEDFQQVIQAQGIEIQWPRLTPR
jgi:hypothetical protein